MRSVPSKAKHILGTEEMVYHYRGSHPPRRPSKSLVCWYSHPCTVPSHPGSVLTYANKRLLQKTQCVRLPKLGHKGSPSALVSQITCSGGSKPLRHDDTQEATQRSPHVEKLTFQPREPAPSEADLPGSVSFGQLYETLRQRQRAKSLPNSGPKETLRYNT